MYKKRGDILIRVGLAIVVAFFIVMTMGIFSAGMAALGGGDAGWGDADIEGTDTGYETIDTFSGDSEAGGPDPGSDFGYGDSSGFGADG